MIALPAGALTEMVGAYLTEKTGIKLDPGMYSAMMVVNDEQDFVAGTVFTNFRQTDIEVSCAGETPAAWRPNVCRAIFKYIFEQLGCVRCTSITTKGNKKARAFLEGLGFQLEGNVRLGYDGTKDALIYGLLRSECRFLADESEPLNGKEKRPPGPSGTRSGSDGPSPGDGEQGRGDYASELEPHRPSDAAREPDVLAERHEL